DLGLQFRVGLEAVHLGGGDDDVIHIAVLVGQRALGQVRDDREGDVLLLDIRGIPVLIVADEIDRYVVLPAGDLEGATGEDGAASLAGVGPWRDALGVGVLLDDVLTGADRRGVGRLVRE